MAESSFSYRRSSAPVSNNSTLRNTNSLTHSNMSRSRSGLSLPLTIPSHLAIPIYRAPPSMEEVEMGGRVLFENFIHEELEHEGLPQNAIDVTYPPPDAFGDVAQAQAIYAQVPYARANVPYPQGAAFPVLAGTPEGFNNSSLINIGGNIRSIADEFAASHQRQLIRQEADQVDLAQINADSFRSLLSELFNNGFDKYRIVALFYFCSDVLIRCVKKELNSRGRELFFWALQFLVDKVCTWVYNHGGWEQVFSKFYNAAMKVTCGVAVCAFIAVCVVYVRKNWS